MKSKSASLYGHQICMQMKVQANLNDDNAKQCRKGNLIYERK